MVDWSNAVVGAVLGYAVAALIPAIYRGIGYLQDNRLKALRGAWYFYHAPLGNATGWVPIEATVKYRFWRGRLLVKATKGDIDAKYRGTMRLGNGTVLVDLQRTRSADPVRIVFPGDATYRFRPASGLILGVDRTFRPVAMRAITSREPLDQDHLTQVDKSAQYILYGDRL